MGSWPVLSGAVDFERGLAARSRGAVGLERAHQVLLLTPWFGEHSPRVPGRIADYPPGVRENGGQYSHGSSWLVDALVELADVAADDGEPSWPTICASRALRSGTRSRRSAKPGRNCSTSTVCRRISSRPTSISGRATRAAVAGAGTPGQPARMLTSAYSLLGIRLIAGELVIAPDAFASDRVLRLVRLYYRGREYCGERAPAIAATVETPSSGSRLTEDSRRPAICRGCVKGSASR